MADRPTCHLCETRKPKRFCPGINAEICPQCCGREREETIHCPMNCEYLLEARRHDRPNTDIADFPHREIRVDEEFIETNRELFTVVSLSLIKAASETPGVVDNDLRDAIAACIKTYLTLDSGIIYESRPENLVAAAVQNRFMDQVAEFKKFAYERTGVHSVKDGDVLKLLIFLQRLELTTNNHRRYGRAFLSSLRHAFEVGADDQVVGGAPPAAAAQDAGSSLIL